MHAREYEDGSTTGGEPGRMHILDDMAWLSPSRSLMGGFPVNTDPACSGRRRHYSYRRSVEPIASAWIATQLRRVDDEAMAPFAQCVRARRDGIDALGLRVVAATPWQCMAHGRRGRATEWRAIFDTGITPRGGGR